MSQVKFVVETSEDKDSKKWRKEQEAKAKGLAHFKIWQEKQQIKKLRMQFSKRKKFVFEDDSHEQDYYIFDSHHGISKKTLENYSFVGVSCTPDGKNLALVSDSGYLELIDVITTKVVKEFQFKQESNDYCQKPIFYKNWIFTCCTYYDDNDTSENRSYFLRISFSGDDFTNHKKVELDYLIDTEPVREMVLVGDKILIEHTMNHSPSYFQIIVYYTKTLKQVNKFQFENYPNNITKLNSKEVVVNFSLPKSKKLSVINVSASEEKIKSHTFESALVITRVFPDGKILINTKKANYLITVKENQDWEIKEVKIPIENYYNLVVYDQERVFLTADFGLNLFNLMTEEVEYSTSLNISGISSLPLTSEEDKKESKRLLGIITSLLEIPKVLVEMLIEFL